MKRILSLAAVFVLIVTSASAQETAIKPVNVPMSFSGTYGELRHNHFHQGVDWRVGGKVGDPIHAIKSGYVWKVSVSNTGYGNAVYINHPDGTTSVYGHMLSFREDLAARVKEEQYARESFSVTLEFSPEEYPLAQGDVIGKVGNTGASAGPHLHMEVRETQNNLPLNYISMGYYSPQDNMAPHFRRTFFYGLDTTSVIPRPYKVASIYNPLMNSKLIELPAISYVAVDAYDIQNGTSGKLAVEEYGVFLDGGEIFHFKVGNVGYEEGPYISSLIQQGEGGADLVKSRIDPGNLLSLKTSSVNDGLILLDDFDTHDLKLEATDEHGNKSVVKFKIRRNDSIEPHRTEVDSTVKQVPLLWYTPNIIVDGDFSYILPVGALTASSTAQYRIIAPKDSVNGIWSDVWSITAPGVALQKNGRIKIKSNVPEELADKAFIARYFKGSLSYAGSRVGFGAYCIATDTQSPVIEMDNRGRIRIKDDRSGVDSVRLEIDGEWHLFKYYRGVLTILDKQSLTKGSHKIKITAIDNCGNSSVFEKTLKF